MPSEPALSTELEVLSRDECLALLGTASVGRIAYARPDEPPIVVPVNYALDGEVIVFRSDPGAKVTALREELASFQVDWFDPLHRTGWSVLIQGFAYETSAAKVSLDPWDGGPKEHWLRVYPGVITGRRLTLALAELDPRGYR